MKSPLELVRVTRETSRDRHRRRPSRRGMAQTEGLRAGIGTTGGRTGRGYGIFVVVRKGHRAC